MATPEPESTLERIMDERRDKARSLREAGSDPYRNDIGPSVAIADVRARYEPTKPAPDPVDPAAPRKKAAPIAPIDGAPMRIAGRVMAKRGMGKTVFVPIRDTTGDLQLYLNVEHLAADDFAKVLPFVDTGDIVAAEGPA